MSRPTDADHEPDSSDSTIDSTTDSTTDPTAGDERAPVSDAERRAVHLQRLREENRRLRRAYTRAKRAEYRRSAAALALVGLVALAGAALFPASRHVLIALAGTGLFAGVLTYYLTPERVVSATVTERIASTASENVAGVIAELGLSEHRCYVPLPDPAGVRLFVPHHAEYAIPDADALAATFVVTDSAAERGLALRPTGDALLESFEPSVGGELATEPPALARQLQEGVVEQFELTDSVEWEHEPGRLTFAVEGPIGGDLTAPDHPIPSFLATGTASGLDAVIECSTSQVDDEEYRVTCRWEATAGATDRA